MGALAIFGAIGFLIVMLFIFAYFFLLPSKKEDVPIIPIIPILVPADTTSGTAQTTATTTKEERVSSIVKGKSPNGPGRDAVPNYVDARQCSNRCIAYPDCWGWSYLGSTYPDMAIRRYCTLYDKITKTPEMIDAPGVIGGIITETY